MMLLVDSIVDDICELFDLSDQSEQMQFFRDKLEDRIIAYRQDIRKDVKEELELVVSRIA